MFPITFSPDFSYPNSKNTCHILSLLKLSLLTLNHSDNSVRLEQTYDTAQKDFCREELNFYRLQIVLV